ncbi:unnamed protein product [Brassica rapa subsp. narinosa]
MKLLVYLRIFRLSIRKVKRKLAKEDDKGESSGKEEKETKEEKEEQKNKTKMST